ncbi:WS/DGAT/MGAT family acyltransferase [Rhodococcus rhodochrous J38]|uniref:wax ester/triacylglycerol synthase domain-containing protein n=2 Tax=Rhodococcus rhodochrous TaxID=1829 RepID=UPI0011A605E4|nr:wax ester/triacylglycerol synthase domain-containing protein [Rhodococcus rhodochrous]TWH42078.1 WS/DGAT/MGAT family acyltransferase [Rhodococcus rhodochrous J38]
MGADDRHMSQPDLMSWRMEKDPVLRSTIVAVALLDRSPDHERFVRMMERGTRAVPSFRRKLVESPFGRTPPRWVDDPDFDLSWHLRRIALPHPGGLDTVLPLVRAAAMSAFDKDRPLWEATIVDGLDDGRAAIVLKVHHSLTDGIGGIQIANEMVDFERDGTDRGPLPEDSPASAPASDLADSVGWYLSTAGEMVGRGVPWLVRSGLRSVTNPVAALRSVVDTARSTARFVQPVFTTLSPVMVGRSTVREVAALDLPLDALRRAGRAADSSLNDAFLAGILLGLRHYHSRHGAQVAELRTTLPISLRREGDAIGGNRITLARFALPLDIADPVASMHRVDRIVRSWRDEPAVPLSSAIAGVLNVLPAGVLGGILEHIDFLASNVPGSPIPLYMAGAEVLRYYPFAPTVGSAVNITLMSHTSHCCIGINADSAAVPDLPVLVESLAEGFGEVLAVGGEGTRIETTLSATAVSHP